MVLCLLDVLRKEFFEESELPPWTLRSLESNGSVSCHESNCVGDLLKDFEMEDEAPIRSRISP